jgi:hypothetical protein
MHGLCQHASLLSAGKARLHAYCGQNARQRRTASCDNGQKGDGFTSRRPQRELPATRRGLPNGPEDAVCAAIRQQTGEFVEV